MQNFNTEYFFLLEPSGDRLPSLSPDKDTSNRRYWGVQIPLGSKPLIFHDGFLELKRQQKVKPLDTPPEVLFDSAEPIVKDNIREALLKLDITNLVINAAIYIDHKDEWHENLWYLDCTTMFDCWDREKSVVLGGDPYEEDPLVLRYSLNHELLAKTPLRERLFFKMGGTSSGLMVAHYSVAKHFGNKTGVVVLPILDFGDKTKPHNYIG